MSGRLCCYKPNHLRAILFKIKATDAIKSPVVFSCVFSRGKRPFHPLKFFLLSLHVKAKKQEKIMFWVMVTQPEKNSGMSFCVRCEV